MLHKCPAKERVPLAGLPTDELVLGLDARSMESATVLCGQRSKRDGDQTVESGRN